MPTRLARQAVTAAAVRGDDAALLAATAYLPVREAFRYDRRRAAAFSSALAGERTLALGELGLGGGVRSVRLGLDIAVIELLTRGAAPALDAVRLALRDGVHGEPDVPLVLAACVRRDPELARGALGVALGGGTLSERTRSAVAVLAVTRPGPVKAAVPAIVAVSLAVAALAFMRLPDVTQTQEAATPRLQEPRPSVVVAAPPGKVGGGPQHVDQEPGAPEAISIAVRFTPGGSSSGSADGTGSLNGRQGSPPSAPTPGGAPAAPGPSAPEPAPSRPTPSEPPPAPVTSDGSTAAGPPSPPPSAAPPAEPPRQLAAATPSKAERKAAKEAEKAERKAEKVEAKTARKAEKAAPVAAGVQPAMTVPASQQEAEATTTPESASAPESDDERSKREKPDKPEKPEKDN